MTPAGLFALALLTGLGGVGCHARRDSSKGPARDAGRVSAAGAAGTGAGSDDMGPGDASVEAGDASDAAAGSADAGGSTGPIVGTPLGTFDTSLQDFILNTENSAVIVGSNGVQSNIGGYLTGLPRAELSHDATGGSPTAGCLKLSVPFSGGCCEFAEILVAVPTLQDWSRRILHVRVRVASGAFKGVAQLSASSASVTSAWGTERLPADGSWQELTLDVSDAPRSWLGFEPARVVQFGIQFHAGTEQQPRGLVVFQIDSFSLEQQQDRPDAASEL
jgi:hypothetical protein